MKTTSSDHILSLMKSDPNRAYWTTSAIDKALEKSGTIIKSRSTLRDGLRRLVNNGEVEGNKIAGDQYGRKAWKLRAGKSSTTTTTNSHSKGSGGSPIMCIDPNKPTLNAAIEKFVNENVTAKKPFSAFDVTMAIRQGVSDGSVSVDTTEVGTIHISGKEVAKIEHETVKQAVHELFHLNKLPGYTRQHNGQYWAYVPSDDQDPTIATPAGGIDPNSTPQPAPTGGSDYNGTPTL